MSKLTARILRVLHACRPLAYSFVRQIWSGALSENDCILPWYHHQSTIFHQHFYDEVVEAYRLHWLGQ